MVERLSSIVPGAPLGEKGTQFVDRGAVSMMSEVLWWNGRAIEDNRSTLARVAAVPVQCLDDALAADERARVVTRAWLRLPAETIAA